MTPRLPIPYAWIVVAELEDYELTAISVDARVSPARRRTDRVGGTGDPWRLPAGVRRHADELTTLEKPSKPMLRVIEVPVVSISRQE